MRACLIAALVAVVAACGDDTKATPDAAPTIDAPGEVTTEPLLDPEGARMRALG